MQADEEEWHVYDDTQQAGARSLQMLVPCETVRRLPVQTGLAECPATARTYKVAIGLNRRTNCLLGRRTQVSYAGGSACKFADFDSRLSAMNAACCDEHDPDDSCTGPGHSPINCDFECAKILPSFYPACKNIVSVMMSAQTNDFDQLTKTCLMLPRKNMVYAIHRVTNCSAGASCTDGRKNGDEVLSPLPPPSSLTSLPVSSQVSFVRTSLPEQ